MLLNVHPAQLRIRAGGGLGDTLPIRHVDIDEAGANLARRGLRQRAVRVPQHDRRARGDEPLGDAAPDAAAAAGDDRLAAFQIVCIHKAPPRLPRTSALDPAKATQNRQPGVADRQGWALTWRNGGGGQKEAAP